MFLGSPHAQSPRAPVGGSTHAASPLGWPVVGMPSRTAGLPTLQAGTFGQPLTLGGLLPGLRDGRGLPPPPAPPRSAGDECFPRPAALESYRKNRQEKRMHQNILRLNLFSFCIINGDTVDTGRFS